MSFFKRNDPGAPAARRAAAAGGGGAGAGAGSYERLGGGGTPSPAPSGHSGSRGHDQGGYGQQPGYGQQAGYGQQSGYSSGGGGGYSQQPSYPSSGGYGASDYRSDANAYPNEKADYRRPKEEHSYREPSAARQPQPQHYSQPQPQAYDSHARHGSHSGGGGGGGARMFSIVNCPSDALALTNRLVVHPKDFDPDVEYVLIRGKYKLSIIRDPTGLLQPRTLGPSKMIRTWIGLSAVGDSVDCEAYRPGNAEWASEINVEVGFRLKRLESSEVLDPEEMSAAFLQAFSGIPVARGQQLVFDFRGHDLRVSVTTVGTLGSTEAHDGILGEPTEIIWAKNPTSNIKLKATAKTRQANAILAPDFKFEDMGIGGLDTEFTSIFRRAFASRLLPPQAIEKLGISHVKGILLYGPPGTGKTLMARQIGKMLRAREPKVVNGPEILSKFVGQSEENIRKLFADAEKEQKEKGDESGLHIIIFDELDAICKQRGSSRSDTGVGDSVVNQLLSKMDGVDQLNNVLIIGMTNRMDMIDEALLRPGRLEVHIEISLPDRDGRLQILNIHTAKMQANGSLDPDVDLAELADETKNFSGAEIGGLIKSATSFAFNRHVKVGTVAAFDDVDNIRLTRADFKHALEEVQPAFGVSEEELAEAVPMGIIHYSSGIKEILNRGHLLVEQVRRSERTPLVSVLIHGPPGSGKTALAAEIARGSDFPFIKLVSPEQMVGYNEMQKVAQIQKVFSDAYKSPMSVVVVDNLERLLDWNPIGPRFSNTVLQALVVLFGKRPPKGRRLLILATTSNRSILREMGAENVFDRDIYVNKVRTLEQVENVVREFRTFEHSGDFSQFRKTVNHLAGVADFEGMGIKKLLSLAEMAKQDPDPPTRLAESIIPQAEYANLPE